jgi:hypothetical protein
MDATGKNVKMKRKGQKAGDGGSSEAPRMGRHADSKDVNRAASHSQRCIGYMLNRS